LNATGKPSIGQIKKSISKESLKRSNKKGEQLFKKNRGDVVPGAGLKISFKPAELKKTTDRVVSAQVG